ncbi:calmodulin-interacting protein 111-like, partial [Cajanus cajan]|uniref:calmodulin-interacting protein 111-like n=1 Tax=Cajanus cajan TaxID=3821 RepID=UPI00098DCB69
VFIDELDAIAPARKDGGEELSQRLVATLLNLMDGISRTEGLLVIAATNRLDHIEPALRQPGRFDKEIEIAASENKKKRVHGIGHSLDLGTSSSTQTSSPEVAGSSTNLTPMTEERVTTVINNALASFLQTQLLEMMRQIIQAVQPSTTPSTNQHREDQGRDDDFTSLG